MMSMLPRKLRVFLGGCVTSVCHILLSFEYLSVIHFFTDNTMTTFVVSNTSLTGALGLYKDKACHVGFGYKEKKRFVCSNATIQWHI